MTESATQNQHRKSKKWNRSILLALLALPMLSLVQFLRWGMPITDAYLRYVVSRDGGKKSGIVSTTAAVRPKRPMTIDVLSIGSQSRLDYLRAQQESWGSHYSIRFFVNATELDDDRPSCAYNTTNANVQTHVQTCRDLHSTTPFLSQYKYFPARFVLRKGNPPGWLCAQVRPGSGIAKIGRLYQQQQLPLPDYLLIIDDDTMIQMDMFVKHMRAVDSSIAMVWAGCLTILQKLPWYRFSPFGGSGTMWSKGAIERLLQPIFCNTTTTTTTTTRFQQDVCARIQENLILERPRFQEGMFMYEFINAMFQHYPNCYHSDWLLGHVVEYYYLSEVLWQGAAPTSNNTARMHPLYANESLQYFYRNLPNNEFSPVGQLCGLTKERCDETLLICHYVTPEIMRRVAAKWMSNTTNGTALQIISSR